MQTKADKLPARKCKCGTDVTRGTGVIFDDGAAECHECSLTWHIAYVSGIDPRTARMRARRTLAR